MHWHCGEIFMRQRILWMLIEQNQLNAAPGPLSPSSERRKEYIRTLQIGILYIYILLRWIFR